MACKSVNNWDYTGLGFCETQFWKKIDGVDINEHTTKMYPEYFNAFSSLLYCAFGIYLVFTTCKINMPITMLSSMMVITGLGSALFHFTKWNVGAELDVLPMFMTAWIGLLVQYDALLYKLCILELKNVTLYKWARFALTTIVLTCVFITFSFRTQGGIDISFNSYFITPNIFIVGGILLMRLITHREYFDNFRIEFTLWFGFVIALLSAIIRLGWAEPICKGDFESQILQPHMWWHITNAYGYFCLIQVLFYLYFKTIGSKPLFKERICVCDCCKNGRMCDIINCIFSWLIPTIDCNKPKEVILHLYDHKIMEASEDNV